MVMSKEEKIAEAKHDRKNKALGRRNCFKSIAWQKDDAILRSFARFFLIILSTQSALVDIKWLQEDETTEQKFSKDYRVVSNLTLSIHKIWGNMILLL